MLAFIYRPDILLTGMKEPLSNDDAKKEIVRRLKTGQVFVTTHFRRAAIADGMLPADSAAMLPAGFVEFSEFEGDSWRYRVRNGRFAIVVAFGVEDRLNLVTFFKK